MKNANKLLAFNLNHPHRAVALADIEKRRTVASMRGRVAALAVQIRRDVFPVVASGILADKLADVEALAPRYAPGSFKRRGAYNTETIQTKVGFAGPSVGGDAVGFSVSPEIAFA